jgi:hypothetical protein
MARASSKGMQRRVEEEGDLLNAQEVPPWHGEAMPVRPRRRQARGRRRRHVGKTPHPPAPDLTEGKAKRLEMKLEVAMTENRGAGGDGAEGSRGVIDQIAWTGRCTVVGSIDCDPSRRLTPAKAARIEHGGGEGDAVARARAGEGREVDATSARSV